MEETLLPNPSTFVDKLSVHYCDLPRWTTECPQRNREPGPSGRSERNHITGLRATLGAFGHVTSR